MNLIVEPQHAELQILRLDEAVLVEQRNLDGGPADIDDGGRLLDESGKALSSRRNRFVIQKALLRIGEDIDMNAGEKLDAVEHHRGIDHLPDGARAIGAVLLHAVAVHNPPVLGQKCLELPDMLITDFARAERIRAEIDAVRHMINLADAVLLRALADGQADLIAPDVNRAEQLNCHPRTSCLSVHFRLLPSISNSPESSCSSSPRAGL